MRAFVVLGLVFFRHQAKRLARENVSEMTYFVSSGTQKPQLDQIINETVTAGTSSMRVLFLRL